MSTERNSGKPARKRNGDIPLILNLNKRKFREFISANIRDIVRQEIKKFFDQFSSTFSEGTSLVVVLNNIHEELTPRETEVMDLLIKNYNNRQIAAKLGLKIDTIKSHIKNIIRKSGCKSRWQARDLYLKHHPEAGNEDKKNKRVNS